MSSVGYWSVIPVENDRHLIFSQFFNRLYLLSKEQVADREFQALLGLKSAIRLSNIKDAALRVDHQFTDLSKAKRLKAKLRMVLAYKFLHYTRFIPLSIVCSIIMLFAKLRRVNKLNPLSIGEVVHHIEFTANLSDCYPRALLTTYLCLKHLGKCDLFVGVLAPTKLMHAWCVIDECIPYEHLSEHYHYQPLFRKSLFI